VAHTVLVHADGSIVAVGGGDLQRAADRVVGLGGRTVTAGLWDSHLHWLGLAEDERRLKLSDVARLEDLLSRVAGAVASRAPGTLLVGAGWNQNRWDGQLPDRRWLDRVAPANPVVLWARDLHVVAANSAALRLAFGDRVPDDPPGGRYDRDGGTLTGIARERAAEELGSRLPPPSMEDLQRALPAVRARLSALGLVGATGMDPGRFAESVRREVERGAFRTQLFLTDDGPGGAGPVADGPFFRVVGRKRFIDGALGSRTAAMRDPYTDTGGTGIWRTPPATVGRELARAGNGGAAALAVHAIGDAAVSQALEGLAPVPRARSGVWHRVEHAQIMTDADVARFATLGVAASMQPVHLLEDRRAMARAWADRTDRAFPTAWLHQAGVLVILGSDAPVETPDPVLGMMAAVWRSRAGEEPWVPAQALGPWQALWGYTARPAAVDRRRGGVIRPGRWADFTVFDRDPIEALMRREPFSVVGTVVAGRFVHRTF
jgi:predicted amidohydrolase YtcJ